MSLKNKIESNSIYFLTMTVIDWVDIFTREDYRQIIIDSLKYCQKEKGLEIYSWCLMTNHLHLIAAGKENGQFTLSDILRDLKKFTSKAIIEKIKEIPESRRKWLLDRFEFAGRYNKKIEFYKFWQDGNEAKEVYSAEILQQKIHYIHNNPVRAGWVNEPHHYKYSSAIDYAGERGLIDVIFAY
jgi:putative transposase